MVTEKPEQMASAAEMGHQAELMVRQARPVSMVPWAETEPVVPMVWQDAMAPQALMPVPARQESTPPTPMLWLLPAHQCAAGTAAVQATEVVGEMAAMAGMAAAVGTAVMAEMEATAGMVPMATKSSLRRKAVPMKSMPKVATAMVATVEMAATEVLAGSAEMADLGVLAVMAEPAGQQVLEAPA